MGSLILINLQQDHWCNMSSLMTFDELLAVLQQDHSPTMIYYEMLVKGWLRIMVFPKCTKHMSEPSCEELSWAFLASLSAKKLADPLH